MDKQAITFIILNIIGYLASFLSIIRNLPQIFKLIFYKECNDLSIGSAVLSIVYAAIFIICGIVIHDLPLFITNVLILVLSIFTLIFIIIYQKKNLFNERRHWEAECIDLLLKLKEKKHFSFTKLVDSEDLPVPTVNLDEKNHQ